MSYTTMKEMLEDARKNKYAVGAFNIVDYITTASIIQVAVDKNAPVIIQVSVKTVKFYGGEAIANWVKTLASRSSVPIALHLDHCKDIDVIRQCIEAGWSSVMIDASSFSYNTNVEMTKKVVAMAHPKGVTVEGELGAIVGVEDDIFVKSQDSHLADPNLSVEYNKATGIDVFAPAIGTAHGLYQSEPKINFELLREIADRTEMPIAIHGGTGLSDETFRNCIKCGGCKINISTNIKHLFRDSFEEYFTNNPNNYEPIKAIEYLQENIYNKIQTFFDIFGCSEKA